MGVDAELRALMVQTVRLAPKTGSDRYGKDTYGTTVEAACRIDGRTREVIRPDGAKVAAIGRVFLADVYPWLDEGSDLRVPSLRPQDNGWLWAEIVGVDTLYDFDGTPYCQVVSYGEQ